jgi:Zn-dependent protease/predicted transcriptional regulator
VARIAGIDIHVHATFLFLLAWLGLSYYRQGGAAGAVAGLASILSVFTIVVLHEYGHALTARRYGIATRDITLLPIGGVARLESIPRDPRQELAIAVAGPAVNIALALIILAILVVTGGGVPPASELFSLGDGDGERGFLAVLLAVNVWLVLFNMIPAFPMDGGRVLRAVLALRSNDYTRATEQAARVGQFFALVFGLVGLFVVNNPFLVFIALFVWLGAAGEAAAVRTTSTLDSISTGRVMITDVRTVAPAEPLSRAVELTLAGFQQDFPVLEHGGLVGVLTRSDLLKGLTARGLASPIGEAMHRDFQVASPDEPVEHALARLKSCDCQALPVVRGRELLGVLTVENVGEFMMLRAALRGPGDGAPRAADGVRA